METQYEPPEGITMKFCLGCGESNRHRTLYEKHFSYGTLCWNSQIVTVTYSRKAIRNESEEK